MAARFSGAGQAAPAWASNRNDERSTAVSPSGPGG